MFENLYAKIDDPTALKQSSDEAVRRLKSFYPELPPDYFAFLAEVGYGKPETRTPNSEGMVGKFRPFTYKLSFKSG